MEGLKIIRNSLTVRQYQWLRATTNWETLANSKIEEALAHDLFSITVFRGKDLLGMGRVVGDGAIYFYVQDVIVHPKFKKRGIGKLIMTTIQDYLDTKITGYAFVGLMAAKGTLSFYEKLGYSTRDHNSPGMYKIIK